MIVRFEPWGAWVKLEQFQGGALVALDRDGVRSLGLDGSATWNATDQPPSRPIEVHVAVTSRCGAGCEGCYLDARPDGIEPPRSELRARFAALARAGVFTVAFGGGEPTLREDLGLLADDARAYGLTPVVTTSGLGLGDRKLAQLARFAQVNVSYDGSAAAYASVRGFDGAHLAEDAIRRLVGLGITVGINVVLTRATFDDLEATLDRAHRLGAREAQLLRFKPAGRAKNLDYLSRRLRADQSASLGPLVQALVSRLPDLRLRIDCALVPFFSADPELSARPADLARWGVLGCEAGGALAATKVDGALSPCSFAEPSGVDASAIGTRAWATDPVLQAYRAAAADEPCASCTLRSICRGGCKIVSSFVDGQFGPDPECPRVRTFRSTPP